MNFLNLYNLLFESIELKKPKNLKSYNKIENKGTNTATESKWYKFKTSKNNEVVVKFVFDGIKSAHVMFYVNGSLHEEDREKDSDILPSVFWIIKEKSNLLKLKNIHFSAFKDEKDKKVIKNIKYAGYDKKIIEKFDEYGKLLETIVDKEIGEEEKNRKIALYNKLNKPIPEKFYILDRKNYERYQRILKTIRKYVYEGSEIISQDIVDIIKLLSANKLLKDNEYDEFKLLWDKNYAYLQSQTESGYIEHKNRRLNVYTKLVNKFFKDDWDISCSGERFYLDKKVN